MLAILLLAAVLDFGPERALGAHAERGPAPRGRERARVAASDAGALVVWSDGRTGAWQVYGARVDRDGALLDPLGRTIAPAGIAGDVVWTGREWLVAYSVHPILYVRTVSSEGVLGEPMAVVDTEWVQAHTVRMATDGETVLLMTNSGRGAVLSLDGRVRRVLNFGVLARHEFSADIAVADGAYGLASITPAGVAFRRIRAESEEPEQILPGSAGAKTVALGSDGTSFLAVYDNSETLRPHLRAQRIGDPAPKRLANVPATSPTLVWRGGHYLVTFTHADNPGAMAVHASAAGEPLGEPVLFATASAPSHPDADRRPDGTGLAAWVTGHHRVEIGLFDTAGPAPSPIQAISLSGPEQNHVRVDARGSAVVAMWLETAPFRREVRLSRGIGGPSIVVASGDVTPVDVFLDGDVVWAVWGESARGVHVRRYTSSLAPIDAEALRVFPSTDVSVAAGGGALLLVAAAGEIQPGVHVRLVREIDGALAVQSLLLETADVSRMPVAVWARSSSESLGGTGSNANVGRASARQREGGGLRPALRSPRNSEELRGTAANVFTIAWALPGRLVTPRVDAHGHVLDAAPVTVDATPNIATIEAVSTDDGVVLVWQTSQRATFAARVASGERRAIDNPLGRRLAAATAIGEHVLLLWTASDTEYVLLSGALAEEERGVVPVPATELDVASAGTAPVIVYARTAAEHGNVFRAFARTALAGRQRTVRR